MSDFVLWVRRMSVTLAVVVLAAGVSWADEPNHQGADDPLEAPQMEDQHDGDDIPGPNPGPGTGQDTDWISIGNPPVTPGPAQVRLLTAGGAGHVIDRGRKRSR